MSFPADWTVPDWPAPAGVRAVFTSRCGGNSAPPFDSFNLGDHVGDDPAAVAINRQRLREILGARPVFLQQVHGAAVAKLDRSTPDGVVADACVTQASGVACTIMVADCLPVLLTDRRGRVLAAAHAGWRGLAGVAGQGVLEAVFKKFCEESSVNRLFVATESIASETLAWLGPCIGPQAFEVGAPVREAFCDTDSGAARLFQPRGDGKFLADLAGLARRRLRALGITHLYGNDGSPAWCTVSQSSVFFSHRRDAARLGGSGRLAACIWRAG